MKLDCTIRPASLADATALTTLLRSAFAEVAQQFGLNETNAPKHVSNCEESWIVAALEKGVRYYVLEADGECLGCVALEQAKPTLCYLERLAVRPDQQGQGLGAQLVRHTFAEAARLGANRIEIGIIAAHTQLHDWYGRLGFIDNGRKTFAHLPFEVCFMACDLTAPPAA